MQPGEFHWGKGNGKCGGEGGHARLVWASPPQWAVRLSVGGVRGQRTRADAALGGGMCAAAQLGGRGGPDAGVVICSCIGIL